MCQGVFDKNATKKPCVTVYKACETRTSCINGKVRNFMDKLAIDETRCSQWVKLLGKEDLAYVPIEKLHELKYICGIHFDPEDFNMKRNRLAMSSTPSNNLQCKPSSEEILVGFPCHVCEGDKMTAVAKWITEKESILKLPLEDKRNLYKVKNYLTLNQVESWDMQLLKFPTIKVKKPTSDDLIEFKKMTIDTEKSKRLAQQVSLFKGDITTLEIDAIVNAANSRLKAGGGVDGAIHRAAGPLLQAECDTLHGCPTGEAKITGGYNLPAKYIIHTVGPQDGSESKLQSCYENCFTILKENQLKSIAFPCISTGIYGFPNEKAAHIALRTARKALEADESIARVIFCTFLEKDVDIYERVMQMYFPVE